MDQDAAQRAVNTYIFEYNRDTNCINTYFISVLRDRGNNFEDWVVRYISFKYLMFGYETDTQRGQPLGTNRVRAVRLMIYDSEPSIIGTGRTVSFRAGGIILGGETFYSGQAFTMGLQIRLLARGYAPISAHIHSGTNVVHIGAQHASPH